MSGSKYREKGRVCQTLVIAWSFPQIFGLVFHKEIDLYKIRVTVPLCVAGKSGTMGIHLIGFMELVY